VKEAVEKAETIPASDPEEKAVEEAMVEELEKELD